MGSRGYLLGDVVHVSGTLAVVAAAIVLGNVGRLHGMSERTQQVVDTFWEYVAFVLNTAVFVVRSGESRDHSGGLSPSRRSERGLIP